MIVKKKEYILFFVLLCNILYLGSLMGHYYCIARVPETLPSHTRSGGIPLFFYSSYEPGAVSDMEVLVDGYQFNQKTFTFKNNTGGNGMVTIPLSKEDVLYPGKLDLDIKVHQMGLNKQFFLSLPVHLPVLLQSSISDFNGVIGEKIVLSGTVIHPFNHKLLWKYPVEIQLKNMDNELFYKDMVLTGEDGFFKTDIALSKELEKGWHVIRVKAGRKYEYHPVFLSRPSEKLLVNLEKSQMYYLPGEIFSAKYIVDKDLFQNVQDEVSMSIEILAGRQNLDYEQNILSSGTGLLQAEIPGDIEKSEKLTLNFSIESGKGVENRSFTVPLFLSPFRMAFFHHGYILAGYENLFGFVLTDPLGNPVSKWVTMRVQNKNGDTVYYRNNFLSSDQETTMFSFTLPDNQDALQFHFAVEGEHFQYMVEPLHSENYPFLFRPTDYQYNVGDMLELEFTTEKEQVKIVVEIERDGNILYWKDWQLIQPEQILKIRLGEEMVGNVIVTAHTYTPDTGQTMMSYPLNIIGRNQGIEESRMPGKEKNTYRDEKKHFFSDAPREIYYPLTEQFFFINLIRNYRTSSVKTLLGYRGEWHEITPVGITSSPFFFPDDLIAD